MARNARAPEEIEKIRDNIIEEAMRLILEAGFENMSLRKLARRVGMSATNIYYYYSGKDEIYLNIQIKGFKLLQECLAGVETADDDPRETLRRMIRTYLEFGFNNPDYYQIMLNSNTPRYLEYQDTDAAIEPVALEAKQTAINAIAVPLKVIAQIKGGDAVADNDVYFRACQLWIALHGIITLNNKNILPELNGITPEELIDRMCADLMHPFL